MNEFATTTIPILTAVALQVVGAFVMWVLGRVLIRLAVRLIDRSMTHQRVDATLVRYLTSTISVALNVALVVAILGFFGVETTTFAALIAAAGVAIGMAWSGLLANFAAGAFLIILRPFKTGDFISAGGVIGTVREVGLFATTIVTPDNVVTFVGNNKIFSDTIQNFSANEVRRVDLLAQLAQGTDHRQAIALLKDRLAKIPNVAKTPAPDVEILEFNFAGPVLAVRPYTHTDHYWQVYFDANRLIREAFGEAGFSAPAPQYTVRSVG
jgi:small conductance mechanosensitive channel